MSFYKSFSLGSVSATTATAGVLVNDNTDITLQITVASQASFDCDVYVQYSISRDPSTDADWVTLNVAGETPGDPVLTLTTDGTYGDTLTGLGGKWVRLRFVRNAGSATVTAGLMLSGRPYA